ncbi:MAG: hypothetical protein K2N38_07600 [Oscillospiraceae bacterium]|nr:hypothetical protein [Oscillospiraceae bacterium]
MNNLIIPGLAIGAVSVAIAVSTGIAASLTSRIAAIAAAGFNNVNDRRTDLDKPKSDDSKNNK